MTVAFRENLKDNIAKLLDNDPNSVFILTVNLNSINTNDLQTDLGFDRVFNLPTHGADIIDVFVTNRSGSFGVKVGKSLISTKYISHL